MKIYISKTLYPILLFTISLSMIAQTSLTLDVKPGTLESLIGEKKYTLKELKLTGEINLNDFDIIHQCASRGILEKIDFSEVKLPNNEIPDKAFLKTSSGQAWSLSLKSLILPIKLDRIGYAAFAGCYNMESVQMPESLSILEADVFYECRHLKNIIIPHGITELKGTTFYQCENLESAHLPDGLAQIGYSAFYACHKLKEINLPASIEIIEHLAFSLNFELESIAIPHNVIDIGEYAFQNCKKLKYIELSPKLKEIKKGTFAFVGDELTNINIPEGVEKIGENAFFWVYNLTKIKLPSTLTHIGESSFNTCNLDTIALPCKLNFIGASAFANCKNVQCIYSMNPMPPELGELIPEFHTQQTFDGIDKNHCILYVPKGSSNLYRDAEGWKEFSNIIETDQFPSSSEITFAPDCKVTSSDGKIMVNNLRNKPVEVIIYNINGNLIYQEKVSEITTIPVKPGIYLVEAGNKTHKVVVR